MRVPEPAGPEPCGGVEVWPPPARPRDRSPCGPAHLSRAASSPALPDPSAHYPRARKTGFSSWGACEEAAATSAALRMASCCSYTALTRLLSSCPHPQDELLELQEREEAAAAEAAAARERAEHDALMQQANLDGLEVGWGAGYVGGGGLVCARADCCAADRACARLVGVGCCGAWRGTLPRKNSRATAALHHLQLHCLTPLCPRPGHRRWWMT